MPHEDMRVAVVAVEVSMTSTATEKATALTRTDHDEVPGSE